MNASSSHADARAPHPAGIQADAQDETHDRWSPSDPPEAVPSFDACYEKYATTVSRWVTRLGSSSMDVEDVVQEVFCVVHRKLPTWDGQGNITTWLFRITHHVVRNWNRKRRLWAWLGFTSTDASDLDLPSDGLSPADQIEQQQATAVVRRVLDLLPERHRTLIALFELEELSTLEIAELLDLRVGTVRVRLHRARAEFQKLYESLAAGQRGRA